jgi:hypothetical protein
MLAFTIEEEQLEFVRNIVNIIDETKIQGEIRLSRVLPLEPEKEKALTDIGIIVNKTKGGRVFSIIVP